jgi:hypothetical protein
MTLTTRASAAVLVAATLLAGLLSVSAPERADAAGTCVNGWKELATPDSEFISTPFDIVTRRGEAAWIIGGSNTGVLALKWKGGQWRATVTKGRGHRGLVGGYALGDDRILGVGYDRPFQGNGGGSLEPISGRVVGSTWRNRPVGDPPGPRATLTDVAPLPKGRALAVGTRLHKGQLKAYALVWNGRRWNRSEPFAGTGSGLLGVARTGSGAMWAVGWKETSRGTPRPFIVKRSGGGWTRYPADSLPAGPAVFTDVHFRGDEGYAVGYLADRGGDEHRVILQRWDGQGWQKVAVPWASDFAALPRAVSVGADGRIWIAGTKTAIRDREPRGFIAHGKDGAWRVDTLSTTADLRSEVMTIAATKQGAVAAANVGASLLVLKACGENKSSVSIAASGTSKKKVTRRKVEVSQLERRRQTQFLDWEYRHESHDPRAEIGLEPAPAPGAPSIAGDDGVPISIAAAPRAHPKFKVKNVAKAAGLKQWTETYDGFAADVDGNGYKDVFYSRHGGIKPRLALNKRGRFSNAPTSAFGSIDRHGCDLGDLNGDGDKDIVCAVGASRGKAVKRHELSLKPWLSGRKLARDVLGISDPFGRGRHVGVLRLDNDRYPEVFVANAPDRDDGFPGYNRFYRNESGRLVPAPEMGLDTSHGANCVEASDVDGDGDEDLVYCTQYGFGGRAPGLRFMRNEGGVLKDRTKRLEIGQIGDIDVAFADVTGDGRKDLIQLAPTRLRVSKWTSAGYRRIYELALTDAWAVAAGDASGDKRADIYVVRGNDRENKPDRLLVSKNRGTKFRSVKIPQTKYGRADDVFVLDYDKNGLKDFVVLNGRTRKGPVQLLASFKR